MGYAFISYSTKNQASADAIRNLFIKNKIDTWMAPYDIPAGNKYAAVITKAIRECSCFVLLLTNDSQESEAVDSEVELAALTFRKSIITVQLEDVMLNDSFFFYIHNKQIIPVREVDESSDEIRKILQAVIAYTGVTEKEDTTEPKKDENAIKNDINSKIELKDNLDNKKVVEEITDFVTDKNINESANLIEDTDTEKTEEKFTEPSSIEKENAPSETKEEPPKIVDEEIINFVVDKIIEETENSVEDTAIDKAEEKATEPSSMEKENAPSETKEEPPKTVEEEVIKIIATGSCGPNLKWGLYEDGELVITGRGGMYVTPSWRNVRQHIKKVTIDFGVGSIGASAFSECSNLVSVSLPDSIAVIGGHAFQKCTSLKSINIPNSVTSIGESAFNGCNSLTSINIPDNVTSIESLVFADCTDLININMPDSVTNIGDFAFFNCQSLTSINIPNGVTSIGKVVFFNCQSLTSINIPNGVTSIRESAFNGCYNLASIKISDNVTTIEKWAFWGCPLLKEIIIPASVTTIAKDTFFEGLGLKRIKIYNRDLNVKRIGIPETATIIAPKGSRAHKYAMKHGNPFEEL
ncbi:MAG: leucine-rich repeat protein [Faecalibacterium sp.]|nr:leucine-rich repeat protein [Ruminococcus sp.]MCM1391313.1 leucine-rich repeat protein [Ruminococcus sp.]MCM1484867.1 leucine-rich repeat protein [Faecalibacterium sp.]